MANPNWRERYPLQTMPQVLFYGACRGLVQGIYTLLYGYRRYGLDRPPASGACILVCNHQSHLDPPAVGLFFTRRAVHFIARGTLFSNPAFGWLIRALNSIPIKRGEADLSAIKESLRRLDAGAAVLVFAEGTRSPDGAMRPFERGTLLLLRKSRCPVVPMAVEGLHDVWPRGQRLPRLFGKRFACIAGRPISHDELMKDGPDEALKRLAREIDALRLELRGKLRHTTKGRLPAPGPGDRPAEWCRTEQ